MENKSYPTKKDIDDTLVDSCKVIVSGIPIFGSPVIELMNMLVTPKLQERRDNWFIELGERVIKLEKEGKIDYKELSKNDVFIDISIKATEVALKTHQKEKLDALRNALINSSLNYPNIDISMKQIFINYIDVFTIWHLKLLKLINNPTEYKYLFPNIYSDSLSSIIEGVFPDLKGKSDIYRTIWKDLYSKDLISTESVSSSMTKDGLFQRRLTNLGLNFLEFIEEKSND